MIPTPEDVFVNGKPEFNAMTFPYSYSSLNTYDTCPLAFKRTYLDREVRVGNWFAEIGTLIHLCFEKYLKGELEVFELGSYFTDNYQASITIDPPPFPKDMENNYYKSFTEFFNDMTFDNYQYENITIEGKYNITIDDINIVVKPDAILRRKSDGKIILFDWKTAKYSKKKHDEYSTQLNLYRILTEKALGITISNVQILYVRENKFAEVKFTEHTEDEIIQWVKDTVGKIRNDKEWSAKPSDYYCSYLCSTRIACEFRKEHQMKGY